MENETVAPEPFRARCIDILFSAPIAFDKKIKYIMEKRHISQTKMSRILGVAQGQISNWINGKSLPNYVSLKTLKEMFNLSIDDLF
jgi:transcriptional regulator with XRE-family HTH domain